jgi:hypothetical protein
VLQSVSARTWEASPGRLAGGYRQALASAPLAAREVA